VKFRFLNIPVQIHPTFWIFLLLFTNIYREFSPQNLILGGVFFFSLLVHEYGHALTAHYFGAKPTITFEAFGGYARFNPIGLTPKHLFLITLNGPLLESLLIAIPYTLLKLHLFDGYIAYALYVTMHLNILWCLLNLIPIAPLDGGYLLRYFLERKFGPSGQRASILIGLLSALIAIPILCFLGFYFFAVLLLIFGIQHFQLLKQYKAAPPSHFSHYLQGMEALKNNDLENAKAILKKLLKSKNNQIKHSATESLAKVYLQEGASEKSYDLLLNADPQYLKEGKTLLCKLAYDRQNYRLISQYSLDIYNIDPTFETALLNSKAFAHLQDPQLSGAWLDTASQFGPEYKERAKELLADQIYDPVREKEAFKEYVEKILT